MRRKNAVEICPVEITLGIMGGKWKPVILWRLSKGEVRYAALKRSIPGITQRMLTHQLRELESDGVIKRHSDQSVPPKVSYELSELGLSLGPVLDIMSHWGKQHAENRLAQAD